MGTRMVRIRPGELRAQAAQILDKFCHVVLKNDTTYSGFLRDIQPGSVTVEDPSFTWTRKNSHRHLLHLSDIAEVIVDTPARW